MTTASKSPVLPFQFAAVWGGGGGGGQQFEEVAAEISPLTEVAAAAGDELFGPTSERGVDADGGRRRRSAFCSTAARFNGDGDSVCGWLSSSSLQASNPFLRFPSDYPNLDIGIVSGLLYLLKHCLSLLGF